MKIDLYKWREVKPNEKFQAPKGRLHIMCSKSANLYVEAFGIEVLAGFGQEIDISTTETVIATVEADSDARVFIESPRAIFHESEGEVFTNIDRTPTESGSLNEVRKAMRLFQLEQRELSRQMKAEHHELLRQRKALGAKYRPAEDLRGEPHEAAEIEPPEAEVENELDQPPKDSKPKAKPAKE